MLPSRHMKQLIAGVVILLVIGIGGFLYRNALERPPVATNPEPVACTADARVCPDGASVGRTGPNCTFAACPPPNVELGSIQVSFAVPPGYTENRDALGAGQALVAYQKPGMGGSRHIIAIRAFPISGSATSTILANTMLSPSGLQPKSMSEFKPKIIQGRTFSCITLERFEGQVHTACYLVRASDVLRFEVLEMDVDWMNPALVIDQLPEHRVFYGMLATMQTP